MAASRTSFDLLDACGTLPWPQGPSRGSPRLPQSPPQGSLSLPKCPQVTRFGLNFERLCGHLFSSLSACQTALNEHQLCRGFLELLGDHSEVSRGSLDNGRFLFSFIFSFTSLFVDLTLSFDFSFSYYLSLSFSISIRFSFSRGFNSDLVGL